VNNYKVATMPRLLKRRAVSVWLEPDEEARLRKAAAADGLKVEGYLERLVKQVAEAPEDLVAMRLVRVNREQLRMIEGFVSGVSDSSVETWLDICVCIGVDLATQHDGRLPLVAGVEQ
jgi:hypothetical protein